MKKVFCDICSVEVAEENPHSVPETANLSIRYDTGHMSYPYHLCAGCIKRVSEALNSVGLKVPYWSK